MGEPREANGRRANDEASPDFESACPARLDRVPGAGVPGKGDGARTRDRDVGTGGGRNRTRWWKHDRRAPPARLCQQIPQQTRPPVPIIPARQFRDSLFPMFEPTTAPRTEEQLAATLSQPLVRAKIAQLNIRYLITVSGGTSSEEDWGVTFVYPLPLGAASVGKQSSELSASIWDLKQGTSAGAAQVTASGVGRFAMVTIVPVLIMIPRTEKAACRELGNQLIAFLTGADRAFEFEKQGDSP